MMRIAATKPEVIAKLFVIDDDGKVVFSTCPTAISKLASKPEVLFEDWCEFQDYIMEGNVKYQIRFEEQDDAVEMFIKLYGTHRDPYILAALKFYVQVAGLRITSQWQPEKSEE